MSPAEFQDVANELLHQFRDLKSTVQNSIHTCHQSDLLSSIDTRLNDLSHDVKSYANARGRSVIIERLVFLLVAVAIGAYSGNQAANAEVAKLRLLVEQIAQAKASSPVPSSSYDTPGALPPRGRPGGAQP